MSIRPIHRAIGGRIIGRSLHSSSIIAQELDIRLDVQGRPEISEGLKHRIEKRKARIDIPATAPNLSLNALELERTRIVPKLKTFFGGNPTHEENINILNGVLRKYVNIPTRLVSAQELANSKFIGFEEYRKLCLSGTRLKPTHHKELLHVLNRLRIMDNELMPEEVRTVLDKFKAKSSVLTQVAKKLKTLDEFGKADAVGKRKTSVAEVSLVKGTGETLINGKSIINYFPEIVHRKRILYPFEVIAQEGQYNLFAKVSGGGISGQAEAIMYGIAKALIIHNPLLKPRLYKAGLMTRDTRIVERKKPGLVKARKAPTWVKR